jgi:hypothetical protein
MKQIKGYDEVMVLLRRHHGNMCHEELLEVGDESFTSEHQLYCTERKKFQGQQMKGRRGRKGLFDTVETVVLKEFTLAVDTLIRKDFPHLGRPDDTLLSTRYIAVAGSNQGKRHVDMCLYGRVWKLLALQTKEPYTVQFRSHDKLDDFSIQIEEGGLYSMNETRADCYTHKANTNNDPEEMKVYLLLGFHNNALAALNFELQAEKWGKYLRWELTRGWFTPSDLIKSHQRSSTDQGDDSLQSNKRMRTSPPRHVRFDNDEWAFVMRVLTGDDITPRSCADIEGLYIYIYIYIIYIIKILPPLMSNIISNEQ